MEIHNPFRNIIGSCAQLSKSYRVLNLTEKNRDLLFDTVAPCVKTVCSFIHDNIVRTAEGSTGSCLTMQYTLPSRVTINPQLCLRTMSRKTGGVRRTERQQS